MNKWFTEDVFVEAAEEGDFKKDQSKDEMDIDEPKEKLSISKKVKENKTTAPAVVTHPQPQPSKAGDNFEKLAAPNTD